MTDFTELSKVQPNHVASKILALNEELGGHTRKPNYDGIELRDSTGKAFALLLVYKGSKGTSLYLHNTTIEGVREFARVNGLAWDGRIQLAKKGYEPALLSGIQSDEVTAEFMAAVQLCVADGVEKRQAVRAARKTEKVAEQK